MFGWTLEYHYIPLRRGGSSGNKKFSVFCYKILIKLELTTVGKLVRPHYLVKYSKLSGVEFFIFLFRPSPGGPPACFQDKRDKRPRIKIRRIRLFLKNIIFFFLNLKRSLGRTKINTTLLGDKDEDDAEKFLTPGHVLNISVVCRCTFNLIAFVRSAASGYQRKLRLTYFFVFFFLLQLVFTHTTNVAT